MVLECLRMEKVRRMFELPEGDNIQESDYLVIYKKVKI